MIIRLFDSYANEKIPIDIIEEHSQWTYKSMDELIERFSTPGETQIILIGGFRHGQSMLYKIETPLIRVDSPTHPIYQPDPIAHEDGMTHEYQGPELVARLAFPGECSICHYETGEVSYYSNEQAACFNLVFNGHVILLPVNPELTASYPRHVIVGAENCRKQLERWDIEDVTLKKDIWGQVQGHIEGLL